MAAAKGAAPKKVASKPAKPSRPEEVDGYIAAAPKNVQPKLRQLRDSKPSRSAATITFPLDEPLPATLITGLVRARAKELRPK